MEDQEYEAGAEDVEKGKSCTWRNMASPDNCKHLTTLGVQGYMGKMKDGAGTFKGCLVTKSLDTSQLREIVFRRVCRLSTRKQALTWGAGFLSVLGWGWEKSWTGIQ